jgi:hypothetical protein
MACKLWHYMRANNILHLKTSRYPEPFKVDIKPRGDSAETLVRDGILGDINI